MYRGPVRLREVHVASSDRRTGCADFGAGPDRRQTREEPGTDRMLIFQELGLFPWLTVGQNVEFGMKMKRVPKTERDEKNFSITFAWFI